MEEENENLPVTAKDILLHLIILLAILSVPFGFYAYNTYFTKTIEVTESMKVNPGDSLTGTLNNTRYTGPVDVDGEVLAFREFSQFGNEKERNIPFIKGQPIPFDIPEYESLVFENYEKGVLTLGYTHTKRIRRPDNERSIKNLTEPFHHFLSNKEM